MHLLKLHCEGFRILSALTLLPGQGLNVVRGGNAQGKTSILEALLYLATSKSHRTANDAELAQHGRDQFHIEAEIAWAARQVKLEANWWQGQRRFRVNGVPLARVSDILGKAHVVFFSPEDVGLVRGAASGRRLFLDMELSQLSPRYLSALQQYRAVLRQRNELLRQERVDPVQLDAWDAQLAKHGEVLMELRAAFAAELGPAAEAVYARIAARETFHLSYIPDVASAQPLAEMLGRTRHSDLRRGLTTRGPHRDDLEFIVGDQPARSFASQGQQRTIALALKLAMLEVVRARIGEYPILMLDDVLSELDAGRAARLLEAIEPGVQCLFTTTGPAPRTANTAAPREFVIQGGALVQE